jgi:F0F1-type ATP synthase membrane subunit b/b'
MFQDKAKKEAYKARVEARKHAEEEALRMVADEKARYD